MSAEDLQWAGLVNKPVAMELATALQARGRADVVVFLAPEI